VKRDQLLLDLINLPPRARKLGDKQLQRVARRRRYGRVVNLGCQLLDTVNALGCDNAKLGKMRPQGGREHRALTDE
jgi:hypothetical protein